MIQDISFSGNVPVADGSKEYQKMNISKSFGYWLDHGISKEELKKYYCLNDIEYDRTIQCIQELRKKREEK